MNYPLNKFIKINITLALLVCVSISSIAQKRYWSKEFADAIIDRHANINDLTSKGWEYSNSIVLIGIEKLYYETGDTKYLDYIQDYIDDYVDAQGNISFNADANNLDHLHPGWLCITLYQELGLQKYKLAADNLRAEFDNQPRNESGGFWHKQNYPNQMWADGIYMAEPFLIRYGAVFNDLEYAANEATKQALLLADHAYDSNKHLLLHGWDETKTAGWVDANGVSPEVWSRGMGWYCMALVDILDYLPTTHTNYSSMVEILQNLAIGIKTYQDASTGLWYQVVDKGNLSGNWNETSGSAMFVYALKKAIDKGYIDSETYTPVVTKGWEGLQTKITLDSNNKPGIKDFVLGMGIQTSYSGYISKSRVSTPGSKYSHGYCAILLAASVMEFPLPPYTLITDISGEGTIQVANNITEVTEATTVEVTATASEGNLFTGWSGDITSTDNPLSFTLDKDLKIVANFTNSTSITSNFAKSIKVYPTIVNESLFISGIKNKIVSDWKIVDLNGLTYIEGDELNQNSIPVATLKKGFYFLSLNIENEVVVKMFIKK